MKKTWFNICYTRLHDLVPLCPILQQYLRSSYQQYSLSEDWENKFSVSVNSFQTSLAWVWANKERCKKWMTHVYIDNHPPSCRLVDYPFRFGTLCGDSCCSTWRLSCLRDNLPWLGRPQLLGNIKGLNIKISKLVGAWQSCLPRCQPSQFYQAPLKQANIISQMK